MILYYFGSLGYFIQQRWQFWCGRWSFSLCSSWILDQYSCVYVGQFAKEIGMSKIVEAFTEVKSQYYNSNSFF